MQAEDEELADHVLELLLEDLVALVLGHQLVLPVREGMRARGRNPEPRRPEKRRQRTAQGADLLSRLADVGPDLRAGLDHRLHHLGLDLLAETWPRRGERRRAAPLN